MRFALAVLAGLALCGCEPSSGAAPRAGNSSGATFQGKHPIRVVATTGMVADIATNVGGDLVEVEALMGEGTDPHFYKASPGDVKKLASRETHVVLYSGLHLEGRMTDVLANLARSKPVRAVADVIPEDRRRSPAEFRGHYDPHVWFDVSLWMLCAEGVRDMLSQFDPANESTYHTNCTAYLDSLRSLHETIAERISEIPPEQRVLITAHDAFGYFGRAYGIEVMGVQGISTESEAGVRRVSELVDTIVARKIKAVFVESSVSERNIQALVDGCRAQGHDVAIGGQLFSDAMGAPGTPEGTYKGMVEHNVGTIVEALK